MMTDEQKDDYRKRFCEGQTDLIMQFKEAMTLVASKAISDVYQGVSNYAVDDAHINFYNLLREEAREEFRAEIAGQYGTYSWAHELRMLLLKHHKEELSNKLIEDLQEKVAQLTDRCRQMEERRW